MSTNAAPAAGATGAPAARPAHVLVALACGFVMAMLDVTIVNVALKAMQGSLDMSLTALVWVVDAYTLSFAALLLFGGALANRYGPRAIYVAGLALFVAASVLCAAAQTSGMLVAARLLQGVGAALFMPSSLSLLTLAFPAGPVRTRMIGIWGALVSAAMAIGPCIGGVLVDAIGWRGIFWVNLPVGLAGLWLTCRHVEHSPRHPGPLNTIGHLLGALALAALSYTLIEGPGTGWRSPAIVAGAAATFAAGAAFVWRERRARDRILPPALLRNRRFVAGGLLGLAINFGILAEIFLLSLYLQQTRGASALRAGFELFPLMAMFGIGNLASARVSARLGPRGTLLAGLALATLGSAALIGIEALPYTTLAIAVGIANFGAGQAIPAMNLVVMQSAGPADANLAAASLNASRQIGSLVGVAIASVVLHAIASPERSTAAGFAVIASVYLAGFAIVFRRIDPG
ncbi:MULTISPECIES: MFS transporter [unclassified Burkholderia]|uniref:MFS transporter n=1 Tax=unclassified Burkholderia TaxID=2613784 RepID=UPI000F58A9BD|nr:MULTISPECIES: MFS transporter [unclassified Burkholderia]RQR90224.1 MFS transporter [Burkholderia sp. Bp9011]RQR96288.1 MFS transporter [Burkholderia sp. Bp8994]RQR99233.1 MFS transporter [Burkholderia sp. Bp9010]RQS02705.1 MFS transporter [Burkholderia sp. Bp8991]RQS25444.1 MFS transporter [Burkholderia sp. Bp8995]